MTWQPMDTAPRDGTEILVGEYGLVDIARWSVTRFNLFPACWHNREGQVMHPTHWQPLPDHPPLPEAP